MRFTVIVAAIASLIAAPAFAQVQSQTYFRNGETTSSPLVAVTPLVPLPVTNTPSSTPTTVDLTKVGGGSVPSLGTGILGTALAPTATAAAGITPVTSTSLENSHVLKAGAGNVYSVYASNLTGGASGFLVLLNATSAPGDGAITPLDCAPFSGGVAEINFAGLPPEVFSTGITAVVTSATTCFTKTTGVLTAFISGRVK